MYNFCVIIAVVGGLACVSLGEPAWMSPEAKGSESLLLRLKVIQISTEKVSESFTKANLEVELELVNSGTRPIILLAREPVVPGAYLTSKRGDLSRANILNTTYFGPAVDLSPEWRKLHDALDRESPPDKLTRIIKPGDFWTFKSTCYLAFDSSSSTYPKAKSFKEVQDSPEVWLQVSTILWPFNVEPMANRDLPFGRHLQRRWQTYGHLWIEGLFSEPVLLDLKNPPSTIRGR